jgi:GntR family transcriptional repressor for pyruvate dehydrogenase complex
MAQGLGLSRPTMREAIRRLMELGLIEARRGSGTYVADVDLEALLEVRGQLEPYGADLAARRCAPPELHALRELLARLESHLDRADSFSLIELDLHVAVARAGGNVVLADMVVRLIGQTSVSRTLADPSRHLRVIALEQLRDVVDAIAAGRPGAAADAMREHLGTVRIIVAGTAERQRSRGGRPGTNVLTIQSDRS